MTAVIEQSPVKAKRARKPAPVLKLVPNVSRFQSRRAEDNALVIEYLEEQLALAKTGAIAGCVCIHLITEGESKRYRTDVIGEAKRIPTFMRGALRYLDDLLAKL